jgi:hypothetical protein
MVTSSGKELAQGIRQKIAGLKQACRGVEEKLAAQAPQDRWSPKQVLSHLCGPEGVGHLPLLRSFVESDTPEIALDTENPFFTESRARMNFQDLVSECERNYESVARFAEELTATQLGRIAHVPKLKDSPLGEYPTLGAMIYGLGEYHVQFHIDHLGEILAALSDK